jgi:hypothetical protein
MRSAPGMQLADVISYFATIYRHRMYQRLSVLSSIWTADSLNSLHIKGYQCFLIIKVRLINRLSFIKSENINITLTRPITRDDI